jgi:hypothetical protein
MSYQWTYDKMNPPGPIQYSKTVKALRAITSESSRHDEINRSGMRFTVSTLHLDGKPGRADCTIAYQTIGTRFGWMISKTNHKEIIAHAARELAVLVAARPVVQRELIP